MIRGSPSHRNPHRGAPLPLYNSPQWLFNALESSHTLVACLGLSPLKLRPNARASVAKVG